jgi:dUTP pyrophosphatase
MEEIYFAKLKSNARIPSKRDEDGAYDIYACLDEQFTIIEPLTSKLIPTGICSAFDSKYVFVFEERGSTGIKNIKRNAGVIDSGYRNEWFACIENLNTKPLLIYNGEPNFLSSDLINKGYVLYPTSKAIVQAILHEVPQVNVVEKTPEEIRSITSERGMGMLGSSGK